MRIIAIGLGGAGCRITDSLYATDRRSSKVACVQALAIDVDEKTMQQLGALPENAKMCFSALDPGTPVSSDGYSPTATIDINEIVSRVQNFESGETDAILFCCGLGGSMVDVAPHIIAGLRSTIIEPIFGLVTLPCLAEGERISGKAADDIEMLSTLLDGIILFDNETWHKKIRSEKARLQQREKGFAEKMGFRKAEKILSPAQAIYARLNEAIVRRISLILRAGEFKADGGIDLAEVVLDSGEVLNTMKGMGFITIGYAVERLPQDPLGFLSRWKPAGLFDDDQKKKASRIVELAKQAIYHEISTPCDLTSAHKALILVAGPSHELSMKGFMTVRKWIDRSIAGLETRSGDYPVMNTKNVAIIIMLSGLENIPRITELKEIRSQHKPAAQGNLEEMPVTEQREERENGSAPASRPEISKDEMIILPDWKTRSQETSNPLPPVPGLPHKTAQHRGRIQIPEISEPDSAIPQPRPGTATPDEEPSKEPSPSVRQILSPSGGPALQAAEEDSGSVPESPPITRRRVLVTHELANPAHSRVHHHQPVKDPDLSGKVKTQPSEHAAEHANIRQPVENIKRTRETERQRIERELLRQRMVAITGPTVKKISHPTTDTGETPHPPHTVKPRFDQSQHALTPEHSSENVEKKTIIRSKRSVILSKQDVQETDEEEVAEKKYPDRGMATEVSSEQNVHGSHDRMNRGTRDQVFRAKDAVFEGKGVRRSPLPPVRDSTLLHTDLKPKKKTDEPVTRGDEVRPGDHVAESHPPFKKRDKPEGNDKEISWI